MLKTYMTLLIMNSDTERHFCKLLIKKIVLINHGRKNKIKSQLFQRKKKNLQFQCNGKKLCITLHLVAM